MELYEPRVVPQYPGRVLVGDIPMSLEALTTESLGYFMEVRVPGCLLGSRFNLAYIIFVTTCISSSPRATAFHHLAQMIVLS